MKSTKKQQKIIYFHGGYAERRKVKEINDFLLKNPSINVKSISIDYNNRIVLLCEE
jgi:hypothetical protein